MKNEPLKTLVKEEAYTYIINNYPSIKHLINAPELELLNIPGIGPSTVQKLKAVFDLSQELLKPDSDEYYIKKPSDAYEYLKYMSLYTEENLIVLCLNTKNMITHSTLVSKGTLNSSLVHPREVFTQAIKVHAASIIIAHNHPSLDPTPSKEDISITTRLKECGKIIGIDLIDHIIIGAGKFVSIKEMGII
jgi:DNA repair protein RadC